MEDKQTEILKDLVSPKDPSREERESDSFKSQILRGGQKTKQGTNYLYVLVTVVLIFALVGGGYFLYQNFLKDGGEADSSQETVVPVEEGQGSPTSTPTPEAKLDRAELKVQILNGSGAPGVAGEAQEYLEGLGYQDIDTGNADAYDYEETVVAIKPDKDKYLDLVTKDLAEEYAVADETKELDEDSDFDVVITVGSD